MKLSLFLVVLWAFLHRDAAEACCNCGARSYPRSCSSLAPNSPSGVYQIQPLPKNDPIMVYCETASQVIGGNQYRAFTFLPGSITRRPDAQQIINVLFTDKKNVLLKLKKKTDRSEFYTLIQPHTSYSNVNFAVLVNSYSGYTRPMNAFMEDYIFLGILPESLARKKSIQGFKVNGQDVQFKNCDANPNSLFAFLPNHNQQLPHGFHSSNLVYEDRGVAIDWRSKAKPITNPDRMMPNPFFFLTELHFGGCGCYTSSDRWKKFGYHATAIGIR